MVFMLNFLQDAPPIQQKTRVVSPSQKCAECGHTDNADNNASRVIKKREIELILDTGTVLRDGI